MAKIHIGKKIKEVVEKLRIPKTEFAKKINLTRDGAYKIFEKESIATDQLEKICKVLNHDFFEYYKPHLSHAKENQSSYGFASKEDVEELKNMIVALSKEMDKIRKEIRPSKESHSGRKKKSSKKAG